MAATRKSRKKVFGEGLPTGKKIGTDLIKVYIKNLQAYEEIKKQFVPSDSTVVSQGQGVFKYSGNSWEKGSIFCGYCASLEAGMVLFTGSSAAENFKNFEKTYLEKAKPEFLAAFSMTTTVSCIVSLNDNYNEADFDSKFESLIAQQERKQPKIAKTKEGLQIGSKSTDNYSILVPIISSNGIVSKVQLVAKLTKDKSFFELLASNAEASFEDVIALLLIQTLSKLTAVGLLIDVKTALIENHKVGQITDKKSTVVLSKDGKTVQRSLSAVRNKLIATATQKEAKELFFKWLGEIKVLLKDDESFKKLLSGIEGPPK